MGSRKTHYMSSKEKAKGFAGKSLCNQYGNLNSSLFASSKPAEVDCDKCLNAIAIVRENMKNRQG